MKNAHQECHHANLLVVDWAMHERYQIARAVLCQDCWQTFDLAQIRQASPSDKKMADSAQVE